MLFRSVELVDKLSTSATTTFDIKALQQKFYDAMNDDLNTAIAISHLFDAARYINSVYAGTETITADDKKTLSEVMNLFVFDILGLLPEKKQDSSDVDNLMQLLFSIRAEAKKKKDFATSDKIRDELTKLNFTIKDEKNGTSWSKN